jgi:hypothetical protein
MMRARFIADSMSGKIALGEVVGSYLQLQSRKHVRTHQSPTHANEHRNSHDTKCLAASMH